MISIEIFYKSYQFHHFRTKASYLWKLLNSKGIISGDDIENGPWEFSQIEYEKSLQIELRANLFHAIETLFTLYFCLQPDKNGKVDDFNLFRNLNKKSFYYDKIRKISEGREKALAILDMKVKLEKKQIRFGQYLFYYGVKSEKLPQGLDESIEAIKEALYLLSYELSDTAEYNSYKHALRAIPAVKNIKIAEAKTSNIVLDADVSNSITYFKDLRNKSFSYVTKLLDPERDYKMTLLASNLIYHIIVFRRAALVRDISGVKYSYFGKEEVAVCGKSKNVFSEFSHSYHYEK